MKVTSDRKPDPRAKSTRNPKTREEHLADVCHLATRPWPLSTMDDVAELMHEIYTVIDDASFQVLRGFIVSPIRAEDCAPLPLDEVEEALAECVATAIGDHADRLAQICDLLVAESTRSRALSALYEFSFPLNPLLTKQWRHDRDEALPLLVARLRRTPPLEGDTGGILELVEFLENRRESQGAGRNETT